MIGAWPGLLPAVSAAPAAHSLAWREGDVDLARRVLEETAAVTVPTGPRFSDYVGHLFQAAMGALVRLIGQILSGAGGIGPILRLAALLAAIAAVVLAVWLIAKRVIERRRRAASASAGSSVEEVAAGAGTARDAAGWRRELEARLARGDVAGALEALWWWLAETLAAGSPVDRSWTTRELLDRTRAAAAATAPRVHGGESGLVRLGVELDLLLYGRARPSTGDVEASWRRFERAVR